jgi:hypothetical protein
LFGIHIIAIKDGNSGHGVGSLCVRHRR